MADDENPKRYYSKRHLWVQLDEANHTALVGVTEYLAGLIGSLESVDMPEPADEEDMDSIFAHLHQSGRIQHLRSPLTGRIIEVNKEVLDNCSLILLDPNKYWLVSMEYDSDEELELLLEEKKYLDWVDR